MATTVRIDDETRGWLERIRSQLSLSLGRRVTLEETLHLLTERALRRPDVLLPDPPLDRGPQLSEEAWARIAALPRWYQATIDPSEIDDFATADTDPEA